MLIPCIKHSRVIIGSIFASVTLGYANEGPVAWLAFDNQTVLDSVRGVTNTLEGNYAFMPGGVRGECLRLDGFTTRVNCEAAKAPSLTRSFTLQAWVALVTYSWNWTPLVSQREGTTRGYSFGFDSKGFFGLQLGTDSRWITCLSTNRLNLKTWHHVAAVFEPASGVRLFLDGQPVGFIPVEKQFSPAANRDLYIGRGQEKMVPAHLVREWAQFPSWWSLDGLLDEVKIFDRALTESEIKASWATDKPNAAPEIPARHFPNVAQGVRRFGAYPTKFTFYEQWDALWQFAGKEDLVVKFDELPVQMAFWRGTRFSPCWVTENGKWMADQSLEAGIWPEELSKRGGQGAVGCCEHMSDAQCRFSHVRIVENNDARVVIHWRYALVDAAYRFANYDEVAGQGQYGDEFYTIYPDGVCTRDVTGWWPKPVHRVDQETIFLSEPGTRPEDNCELEALTLVNLQGASKTYSWEKGYPVLDLEAPIIQMVNLKAKYRPVIIVKPGSTIKTFNCEVRPAFSHFPWWNHWPVSRIASDGRHAMAVDHAAHSSLSWVTQPEGAFLYSMTDKPAVELLPLAKSWITPATMTLTGVAFKSDGYDQDQRAYLLERIQSTGDLELKLSGSTNSPIVNPAFVIQGWGEQNATLTINGTPLPRGNSFRYGHRQTLKGTDLIVWLKLTSEKPMSISFKRSEF